MLYRCSLEIEREGHLASTVQEVWSSREIKGNQGYYMTACPKGHGDRPDSVW